MNAVLVLIECHCAVCYAPISDVRAEDTEFRYGEPRCPNCEEELSGD